MKFQVLGPLDASRDGEPVNVGGPRQQIVLSMLLLEANRVIAIDRLIRAVWDEDPPATSRGQVAICISALRRQVLSEDGRPQIARRGPGYLLILEKGALDLDVFEGHVAAARLAMQNNDLLTARAEFRAALAQWRGHALEGIPSRLVQQSVTKLNERRLTVIEDCLECELRLGMHKDLVGELAGLVEEYPLCERLRALLMMALYRAGRPAEALNAYHCARQILISELGIEPCKELQELQQTILNGSPLPATEETPPVSLTPQAAVPAEPVPVQAPVQVPRLLPATIPDFTGYREIVGRLVEKTADGENGRDDQHAVRVDMIIGQGGVGKSTLAIYLAHKLAPYFPDGQLFARLRGDNHQTNPIDILKRFLRVLGVADPVLPDGIEERAELYRHLLGDRRMLIVLDDAMSERQVAALLPGNSACAVIVTSRKRLTGIAANRVELRGFDHGSAIELLTRAVGPERISADPDAATALCQLCGYLPIALRIVAARLVARPHWSVAELVSRLQDDSRRLDELNHEGVGVRASISLTLESLSPDAQRLFRLLAVSNAQSFASWVGSPLLQTDVVRAQDLLEELTEAYLIDAEVDADSGQTRYRFHDLVRSFARELLVAHESSAERQKSLENLLGAVLRLANEAHRHEHHGSYLPQRSGASHWALPDVLVARLMADPLAWYEAERETIVSAVLQAAATGLVEHAWELALNAVTLFESHAHYEDWRLTHEAALKAACRAGDLLGEAAMRSSLGSLYMSKRQTEEAGRQFAQALALWRQLGDRHGSALVQHDIAYLNRMDGNLELALTRWQEAIGTLQVYGDRVAEAHALQNMAQVYLDLGDDSRAHEFLSRAQQICVNFGNRRVGAQVLHRLGELQVRRGELDLAHDSYRQVLATVRAAHDQIGECYALLGLGTVQLKRGDLPTAIQTLTDAQDLAAGVNEPMVRGRVRLVRAEAALRTGELEVAAELCDEAIGAFEAMKATTMRAEAMLLRGQIHTAVGQPEAARDAWQASLASLSALDLRATLHLSEELEEHISSLESCEAAA